MKKLQKRLNQLYRIHVFIPLYKIQILICSISCYLNIIFECSSNVSLKFFRKAKIKNSPCSLWSRQSTCENPYRARTLGSHTSVCTQKGSTVKSTHVLVTLVWFILIPILHVVLLSISYTDCCCLFLFFRKLRLQEIIISKQLKLVTGCQEISISLGFYAR